MRYAWTADSLAIMGKGSPPVNTVSMQCAVVGQVIQSGPRFLLETKQYKSHMAYMKCN